MANENPVYTRRVLDEAITRVLGAPLATALRNSVQGQVEIHRMACLTAFEEERSGPEVDVLRTMLCYLSKHGQYPAPSANLVDEFPEADSPKP